MAEVIVETTVKAPVNKVFLSWNDEFGDIYKYHPGLTNSYLLTDSPVKSGLGAKRHCEMSDGKNWIREKIVSVKQDEELVLDIYEGTMPVKNAVGTLQFTAIDGSKTSVKMKMSFDPKMGFLGRLMLPIMKKQFRPILQGLLESNAQYVEAKL